MAGPWFTVLEAGETKILDTITLSDGRRTHPVRVEVTVDWKE